ncbi:hypothetical protein IAT40_006506 [Kwoniella sp. CBS 6097]
MSSQSHYHYYVDQTDPTSEDDRHKAHEETDLSGFAHPGGMVTSQQFPAYQRPFIPDQQSMSHQSSSDFANPHGMILQQHSAYPTTFDYGQQPTAYPQHFNSQYATVDGVSASVHFDSRQPVWAGGVPTDSGYPSDTSQFPQPPQGFYSPQQATDSGIQVTAATGSTSRDPDISPERLTSATNALRDLTRYLIGDSIPPTLQTKEEFDRRYEQYRPYGDIRNEVGTERARIRSGAAELEASSGGAMNGNSAPLVTFCEALDRYTEQETRWATHVEQIYGSAIAATEIASLYIQVERGAEPQLLDAGLQRASEADPGLRELLRVLARLTRTAPGERDTDPATFQTNLRSALSTARDAYKTLTECRPNLEAIESMLESGSRARRYMDAWSDIGSKVEVVQSHISRRPPSRRSRAATYSEHDGSASPQ